jgi:L-iditol 2-dehydrogenase
MKAAFVVDTKKVEIRDVDIPKIMSDEVLIKVKTVGVCGSDLHLFRNEQTNTKLPSTFGHEVAGDIIKVGNKVSNLEVGDRVTVEPLQACGECEFCKQGLENICLSKIIPGTPIWGGTFAEYFKSPARLVHKISEKVNYKIATLIQPFAVAVHAINRITAKTKDTLVILGSGTVGLLTLVAARESGYQNIICTDTKEFNLSMAKKQGAKLVLNPLKEDVMTKVREYTGGRGADVVLIAAEAKNIIDQALSIVRKRGEICLLALICEKIPVDPFSVVINELTLYGAVSHDAKDFLRATETVNNGLSLNDFITQEFSLDDTQKALNILNEKKENVIKIIVEV